MECSPTPIYTKTDYLFCPIDLYACDTVLRAINSSVRWRQRDDGQSVVGVDDGHLQVTSQAIYIPKCRMFAYYVFLHNTTYICKTKAVGIEPLGLSILILCMTKSHI
jgi:hypothetical protein